MATPIRTRGPAGLWLLGGRGAIATCVAYGLAGCIEGLLEPIGLCTEADPLRRLDLVPLEGIVLGGADVCRRSLTASAAELVRAGVLGSEVVASGTQRVAAYEARLVAGLLDEPEVGLGDIDPRAADLGAAPPREQIARVQADLAAFASENKLARVVVTNVASTEAWSAERPEWTGLERFEEALDAGVAQPSSILYAYAALSAGHPYVNFTPSRGSAIPALRELARERGVPHAGNDGKTGETLVKTALAPMFRARALRVLAWQGYNMLGNRDGEVLRDPGHRASKLQNKDDALRRILDDPDVHTHVGIDYVPSLADWKTAWDFVHFEGFLGARMSLQFTWTGSDSALAAPLVLDLFRLVEAAAEEGLAGELAHLAGFFKSPLAGGPADFHAQHAALLRYAAERLGR